jgi:hypothetical protein
MLVCAGLFPKIVLSSSSTTDSSKQFATYGQISYPLLHVVFSSTFETGDVGEWNGDGGGGIYGLETGSQLNVVTSPVHTGSYAGEFFVPDPSVSGQIKVFRWRGIDLTEGYYAAWYYFPQDFQVKEWINIMQWKEKDSPYDHELAILAKQTLGVPMFAFFWRASTGEDCESTNATIPLGRWVHVEAFVKIDKTMGEVKIWVDGQISYAKSNIETEGNTPTVMFGVGSYPGPNENQNLTIYIDDVAASTSYVG